MDGIKELYFQLNKSLDREITIVVDIICRLRNSPQLRVVGKQNTI